MEAIAAAFKGRGISLRNGEGGPPQAGGGSLDGSCAGRPSRGRGRLWTTGMVGQHRLRAGPARPRGSCERLSTIRGEGAE
eukprot:4590177-Heterocapsa_arctica.AAC.1